MEKRVLLAVVLSFVVLYGYQAMFPPPPPPAFESAPAGTPAAGAQNPPAGAQNPPLENQVLPAPPAGAAAAPDAPLTTAAVSEQEIVVESPAVRAVFTTRGGALESWRLKNYQDSNGAPLDLVPADAPVGSIRPFTMGAADPALAATLSHAIYRPSADSVSVGPGGASLSFEYQDASGLTARKQFTFSADRPYVIGFSAQADLNGTPVNPIIHWGPAIGTGRIGGGMTYNPPSQPIFFRDGEATRLGIDDLPAERIQEGAFEFSGVDDHYFLSALLQAASARLEYDPVLVPGGDSGKGLQFVSWSVQFPEGPQDARFFFGPKDFDALKAESPELTHAIDFGMFRWLVVPLLNALKWVHGYLGNYGWAIIALTVLINLVMFPLRHKSVVSMRRMQELQPEVKAIQDRYAKLKMSDPARQKMNQELMNLYRERGVNPASGCVPMILTFPVLFAFYAMLSVAIEIRGAPFVGWIQDLSAADPYFIWPVIMGISMVVQQKMMPQTMSDPMQQKMMMMMPVIFSVMLAWAPSGLVLYWTASNLWTIGQQAVTNRIIGPPSPHAVRPPAERRIKTAGAGKSPQAARERK
jgi:YidC/Oxa1 family membrane protein insertase